MCYGHATGMLRWVSHPPFIVNIEQGIVLILRLLAAVQYKLPMLTASEERESVAMIIAQQDMYEPLLVNSPSWIGLEKVSWKYAGFPSTSCVHHMIMV